MNKVRQQDNSISLIQKDFTTYFRNSASLTETSESPTPFKPIIHQRKATPCILIFFVPADGMTYHCESLTDIDEIIAKYTATAEGKHAMKQAEDELHRELYQEVLAGKLNKVKYYRIINDLDQKTLAQRSGLKQSNISRLERPDYVADAKTYRKLAKVFKINYKDLLP